MGEQPAARAIEVLLALTNLTNLTLKPSLLSSSDISQLYRHLPGLAALSCVSRDPAALNAALTAGQRAKDASLAIEIA
jgi:hypothetical protein